ncbi:hypothetical protein [Reyranella sp.]|jgi:hypothetical protein|uniref:hypothetical protein n=1 Tax=Reyranella sp. TaxID=1929291 RepID=UPI0011F72509|nr:hypothetical protein [Reyranella sp.]TAJ84714.1 MAG: hypothetical protein EPO50_18710 [Reyranella sp.]
MSRSLNAPLSPNEEITLRRVALGISCARDLSQRDLVRLKTLSLVEMEGDRLQLTPDGRLRYKTLPRATSLTDAPTYEELVSALAERMRKEQNQSQNES